MAKQDSRLSERSAELFRVLQEKGFPEDFCREREGYGSLPVQRRGHV